MKVGDKIKINNGPIETLIAIDHPYGLFESLKYRVVRRLVRIRDNEWVSENNRVLAYPN